MITCIPCVLLLTKSWIYAYIFFHLWNMCCFTVELLLDVEFEMDFEADTTVWRSDIDPVMLEDWLKYFEDHS
jgi:hypothetical protein